MLEALVLLAGLVTTDKKLRSIGISSSIQPNTTQMESASTILRSSAILESIIGCAVTTGVTTNELEQAEIRPLEVIFRRTCENTRPQNSTTHWFQCRFGKSTWWTTGQGCGQGMIGNVLREPATPCEKVCYCGGSNGSFRPLGNGFGKNILSKIRRSALSGNR
jgi:hypothetical protein